VEESVSNDKESLVDANKRAVIRLQLDIEAKKHLDQLCERRGMTQISVLSRLMKWFSKQDEVIQAGVLGLLSEEAIGELTQGVLKRMASKAEPNQVK
jgi:hypothetical protein